MRSVFLLVNHNIRIHGHFYFNVLLQVDCVLGLFSQKQNLENSVIYMWRLAGGQQSTRSPSPLLHHVVIKTIPKQKHERLASVSHIFAQPRCPLLHDYLWYHCIRFLLYNNCELEPLIIAVRFSVSKDVYIITLIQTNHRVNKIYLCNPIDT